jgi:hypothetical protein
MITVRFNHRRYVASFDSIKDLNRWLLGADLHQAFMYTLHGADFSAYSTDKNQIGCVDRYLKKLKGGHVR